MRHHFLVLILSFSIIITPTVYAKDIFLTLEDLHDQKNLTNYERSIEVCEQLLNDQPDNFDIIIILSRSYRWRGELAKRQNVEGWDKICAKSGKEGMKYAAKAIELEPNKPDGYMFYALNVGIYSDGVSIIKAVTEGLKDKAQSSLEKVYTIDKMFKEGGALIGLGRFWMSLPWPLNDNDLALKYLREYQKTEYFGKRPEGVLYLAELLINLDSEKYRSEIEELLTTHLKTDSRYFNDYKKRLMEDMK